MKKILVLFCMFSCLISVNAQEKRTLIKGKTILGNLATIDSIGTFDIHVININTNKGTITNNNGSFEIAVKLGDSLYFSHINLQKKIIYITDKILSDKNITVTLNEKTETLNEIVLEEARSIFYQDPEITTYKGPTINAKSLHLPYANTKAKKNTKIANLNITSASVNLDNLLNALNGTNKKRKQLQKFSDEDNMISKIRKHFTDDFFVTDLNIKQEYINQFLNDCVDKNIISIFKSDQKIKLTTILIEESRLFPHKKNIEDLLITNQ
ncbi:carboxypeptidase-like regulatory domain-containing protein [Polaribacter sargassicola]|uniref:carboxypeptidase-like regulatory domain-containing protein n=1 Tax=Polaribacter sargassicola TaxID=2836891 RepID=UPI001F34A378|nr:carboxypeptidase-like regulatory domain-containing protein [Polaribacter sp. DS7-9]MCG1037051.1 hypothetical protein [Polaribacter sp. DS7-9]